MKRQLAIRELERLKAAKTLAEAWGTLNNDLFFEFGVMYAHANREPPSQDASPETGPKITLTIACLEHAVANVNLLFSLDPRDRDVDVERCRALLALVQDELGESRRATPRQSVMIGVVRTVESLLHAFDDSDSKRELLYFT